MATVRAKNKTRAAGTDDVGALVELTKLARQESPLTAQLCTVEPVHLANLLEAWIALEESTLLVEEVENKIVGFALVQQIEPNLFSDVSFMQIEGLFVKEEFRRRGIARNLLTEVAKIADAGGIEHIVTIVLTGSRQELRFLAGLGFEPAGARRVVDTATLSRRLARPNRERRIRSIDELIARRRKSRDFTTTG